MQITVLTLFPEVFPGLLNSSLIGRALENGIWNLEAINIRDFALDKHKTVDDAPYGGGAGMLMRADVVGAAAEQAVMDNQEAQLIYPSPRGELFNQGMARDLSGKPLIILCGRFEGVDERVIQHYGFREVSIGDYVLTGGELAAMVIIEAAVRLLPGVVGDHASLGEESFGEGEYADLLEYPQYTRPPEWKGYSVPEVLLSGNHAEINKWRLEQARLLTKKRRGIVSQV